ncbi:hypothetical protein BC936DRAFT_148341 [Jimgerdemannia flammicorona]|uniref:Uncharacterized protein n=2 Tax=Jimgerdemannia flammicorona TaxID=994334 RepID=A0A433QVS8_9FUNG|nr:hypothetical protein BC936DRAFT_148341 [Jimgerdemannia flammicorona]RUS33835.1 hypothetical protein BC938DRAFT_483564 [Jimgerdemannia flammicorona]
MAIAYRRSNIHYYDDGDVALVCPSNRDDEDEDYKVDEVDEDDEDDEDCEVDEVDEDDEDGEDDEDFMEAIMEDNVEGDVDDGNGEVAFVRPSTIFKVHGTVLRLASSYFNARLSATWSSESRQLLIKEDESEDSEQFSIAKDFQECQHHIFLDDEEDDDEIALLVTLIYPVERILISWDNVIIILRLADKYLVAKARQTAVDFLMANYSEEPITSLRLAETYNFPEIFKKSSTHIINNVCAYKQHPGFDDLSDRTRRKLFQARLELSECMPTSFPFLVPANYRSSSCRECNYSEEVLKALVQALRDPTSDFLIGLRDILKSGNNLRHSVCMMKLRGILEQFVADRFGAACPTLATLESMKGFSIELDHNLYAL